MDPHAPPARPSVRLLYNTLYTVHCTPYNVDTIFQSIPVKQVYHYCTLYTVPSCTPPRGAHQDTDGVVAGDELGRVEVQAAAAGGDALQKGQQRGQHALLQELYPLQRPHPRVVLRARPRHPQKSERNNK
eukprot:7539924-Pyramimonas_sp.AAC.2